MTDVEAFRVWRAAFGRYMAIPTRAQLGLVKAVVAADGQREAASVLRCAGWDAPALRAIALRLAYHCLRGSH